MKRTGITAALKSGRILVSDGRESYVPRISGTDGRIDTNDHSGRSEHHRRRLRHDACTYRRDKGADTFALNPALMYSAKEEAGQLKLPLDFFSRDVLVVAPELLGKILVRKFNDGRTERFRITEVEAYRGEEDKACHAHKGRTRRTEVMYHSGGKIYVYLIYGMYWMLNIVTGKENEPQAALIRGLENVSGPGRVGKALQLDAGFYGETLLSERIWLEYAAPVLQYETTHRIGVDYAAEWKEKAWRFVISVRIHKK
jgi:DNA-3-methyladenine glycosylase